MSFWTKPTSKGTVKTSGDHRQISTEIWTSHGSPGTFSAGINVAGVRTIFSYLSSSKPTSQSPVSVPQGYCKIISRLPVPSYGHLAIFFKCVHTSKCSLDRPIVADNLPATVRFPDSSAKFVKKTGNRTN